MASTLVLADVQHLGGAGHWHDVYVSDDVYETGTLAQALRNARQAAQQHMTQAAAAPGMAWHEETVTDLFLLAARPYVLFETFTKQKEEPALGADWIWWWVDDTGECFGMLVQAKRMHVDQAGNKTIDFRYKSGEQLRRLGAASDALGVPAMYVLYLGDNDYRSPLTCGEPDHAAVDCEACNRWSVAMMTWLLASMVSSSGRDGASAAFNDGFPLEDLADPERDRPPIRDLNLRDCAPELQAFLTTPQTGARLVAKTALRAVSQARLGMYSMDTLAPPRTVADPVFDSFPADSAHFSRPYLDHVLRGLRSGLPDYVRDLRAGLPMPATLGPTIAGVAVFAC